MQQKHLARKEFRLLQNPIANTLEPKDSESCCIEVAAVVCVLNESHGKSTEGQHMCFVHLSDFLLHSMTRIVTILTNQMLMR